MSRRTWKIALLNVSPKFMRSCLTVQYKHFKIWTRWNYLSHSQKSKSISITVMSTWTSFACAHAPNSTNRSIGTEIRTAHQTVNSNCVMRNIWDIRMRHSVSWTYTVCHIGNRMAPVLRVVEESVAFAPTHSLVLDVPMLLLTLDGAVARVPTAVVHRLFLAVIALTQATFTTAITLLSNNWLTELRFHVPLNSKLVILVMLFRANLLASTKETKHQYYHCTTTFV